MLKKLTQLSNKYTRAFSDRGTGIQRPTRAFSDQTHGHSATKHTGIQRPKLKIHMDKIYIKQLVKQKSKNS